VPCSASVLHERVQARRRLGAVVNVKRRRREPVGVANGRRGERKAPVQHGLEQPLGHLACAGVPLREQQNGGQRPLIELLDVRERDPTGEGDVRPAVGTGPLAGDHVWHRARDRSEVVLERLVTVVLVTHVDEGNVADAGCQGHGVRCVDGAVVDREQQRRRARSRVQRGLADDDAAGVPERVRIE
jgi:hypothetical protein